MYPLVANVMFRMQERLLGRPTFAILRALRRSQYEARGEMEALQLRRLQSLVATAYEQAPYWRAVMERGGFQPADIRTRDDLRRFPLLDRETVRRERERMVWRGGGRRETLVRTSGSTNEALQFYTDPWREAQINAARIRGHEWIGVRKGDREMYFWGSPVELSKQDRIKKLRDALVNDGLTNGFALKPELVRTYFDDWRRWRPKCIFGYVNSLTLMALMARAQGIDLRELAARGLRVICTTSEMLTPPDRAIISESFGVPVFDSYGLREGGLIGHECACGTMHTVDEQLILETIDPVTLEPTDGEGELVLTNIVSPVMPMIRYRTGDVVRLSRGACRCGLGLGGIQVTAGRVAEFVVAADGRWVPGYVFIYACRAVPGIVQFQVRQERVGNIEVRAVVDPEFPADGIARLREQVCRRLSPDDEVVVTVVDELPPLRSGKHRTVVSLVAEEMMRQQRAAVAAARDAALQEASDAR